MATENVTRYIRLKVDASGAKSGTKEISRSLQQLNKSAARTEAAMSSLKTAFAGAFAIIGVRELWDGFIGGAADAQKQMHRLQGLLKATGGASKKSLEDIWALSRDVGRATLASTQEVRDAAGGLLTFKSVAGDVFDRAIRLSQDLAETGFGNIKTNAIQLGKALEDPVKGISALAEVGVTFSDQQKEQIAGFIKTNDLAKAQGVILDALAGQVGGAGKAAAKGFSGALDTLGESFKEFKENLGGNALEPLTAAIVAATHVMDFLAANTDSVAAAMVGLAVVAIPKVIVGVKALTVAMAGNPIGLIAVAAAAAGVALYKLSQSSVSFGGSTAKVWTVVKTVFGDFLGVFENFGAKSKAVFDGFMGWLESWGTYFQTIFNDSVKIIVGWGTSARQMFDDFGGWLAGIGSNARAIFSDFGGLLKWFGGIFKSVFGDFSGIFEGIWNDASQLFDDFNIWLTGLSNDAGFTFSSFGGFAKSAVNFVIALGKSLYDAWIGYFKALWEVVKGVFAGIGNAAIKTKDAIALAFSGDFAGASTAMSQALEGFDFSGVADVYGDVAAKIGGNFGTDFIGNAGGAINAYVEKVLKPYLNSVFERSEAAEGGTGESDLSVPGLAEGGAVEALENVSAALDKVKGKVDGVKSDFMSAGEIIKTSWDGFLGSSADALANFAKTGKINIRDMVSDMLSQLVKLAANALLKQLLGGLGGLGGSGGLGAALGGLLPGFAQGGSFTVGGGGATDSKLVAFRASPGERVNVSRPDQGQQSAPQAVKVVNVTNPNDVLDAMNTPAGERVMFNLIERNPAAVQQLLSR